MKFYRQYIMVLAFAVLAGLAHTYAYTDTIDAGTDNLSTPVTVLELFTSQGCSSCPKANKFVRDLSESSDKNGDILTLSYSVDYWDYLGWKDTFGKPEFSARQRTYGKQFAGQVYTPQMVINGAVHSSHFTNAKVRTQKLKNIPHINIIMNGDTLDVNVSAIHTAETPLSITAVRYRPGVQSVPVKRGENRGRTLNLANVVQACQEIGHMNGTAQPEKIEFSKNLPPLAIGEAFVILVHDGKGGPILSAANYMP